MPCSSIKPASKPNFRLWIICIVLSILARNTDAKIDLTVPYELSLLPNMYTQELSISWLGGETTTFDLIILRTEFNETVFYDTVSATVSGMGARHQWNWTSVEPLECTSLSIKIRSRDGQTTSEWSKTEILQGKDLPSNMIVQMFPQDRIVPVGANTTFCCIVGEGAEFADMNYSNTVMKVKRLSRRTYASTVVHQGASDRTGTNVICSSKIMRGSLAGAVVFVGYPPQPTDFVCETYDLISAVCRWNEGRYTYLHGKRATRYSVNNRDCTKEGTNKCSFSQWDGNWTLVAVNPLGQYRLTDSAEIGHRVCPVAPVDLSAVVHAWNATLMWRWTYKYSLPLVCQVEVTNNGYKTKLVFSGVGLQSVVLSNLNSYEDYGVQVRCGHQKNFWKWGNWSTQFNFKTKSSAPDAPNVWMWINRDNTGLVVWKPLTRLQSHGLITRYVVTLCDPKEDLTCTKSLPPGTFSVPVNLTQLASFRSDNKVIATVTAENDAGLSQPASVPLRFTDVEPPTLSRAVYTDSGFPLFWQHDGNITCSYVVEWHVMCSNDCLVEWIKVDAGSTNVTIESDNFQAGVRYYFSLYSCPYDSPQITQRWQGYTQELTPSRPVPLSITQDGSSAVLTWEEIPLVDRRGFVLGYNVYRNNGFILTLLANLSDPRTRKYKVKGLSASSYKFTVKAYTLAGEDTGSTISITLERNIYQLVLEILISLGVVSTFLIIVTFICYKKRKWVKKAFYPDIPEPKLPGDWSRTQGPLNVKPSHHSLVHIVERPGRDSSKEALVVIPEQDEDDEGHGIGDEPVDTDEPHSLRYYNQVVDERPIRPRFPDSSASSASSMDSAHTDVTYTGIQTSASSLVFQLDPQGSDEGHQLQVHDVNGGAGGDYRPQMHPTSSNDDEGLASPDPFLESQASNCGGYKPQNSWHLDSPTEACERDGIGLSLGSPTSVASTQFLLPDGEECEEEKRHLSSAATWFTNLLSSTKP